MFGPVKSIVRAFIPYGILILYRTVKPVLIYRYHKNRGKIHVYSIEDTVEKLIADRCSMVRFGDGEMDLILGNRIKFQKYDRGLAERLREILGSGEEKLLVCVPGVFEELETHKNKTSRVFWRNNLMKTRKEWENICKNKNYYDAFVSRPYFEFLDKTRAGRHFERIAVLWDNENVILVEGEYSRLGCGNNLFGNIKSIKRILCPAENAYDRYEEILEEAKSHDKKNLILISLGPAAKLLAFDLYKQGYRVLDIGHIDIEYEWYLKGTRKKIKIQGKYVNEVNGGDKDLEIFYDKKYEHEIIKRIL